MQFSLRALFLFASVALLSGLTGCVTESVTGTNPVIPAAAKAAQLRRGDSLTVSIQGVPDPATHPLQIDDRGLITLPYIGAITAAETSPAELTALIREAYISKKIYTTVDVSVSVTERYVYAGGEVVRPGRIAWAPDLTLTKAIQAAGGFTLYAREEKVSLVRDQNTYDLSVKLAQKDPAQDPRLMPGDSIQVPRSAF